MKYFRMVMLFSLMVALLAGSCGKKKEAIQEEDHAKQPTVRQDLVTDEEIPFKEMIEGAGYAVSGFKKFPAQDPGVKGRVLLYSDGKKNGNGGILYFQKRGTAVSPAWHWYLEKFSPDSIEAVEINEDGLWDIRVRDARDKVYTFVQEESFTLSAKPREDFIALNGVAVPPALPEHPLWMCFDGDTNTTWESELRGKNGAALELAVPFGVTEGILTIETAAAQRPKTCDVYTGGKKIDELKLSDKPGRQLFRLSPTVRGAKDVRIVFTSSYGNEAVVAVAELSLR